MRWLFLFISFFVSVIFTNINREIIEVEKDIYELYSSNFDDYLKIEEYRLVIDKNKLEKYFKSKGYEILLISSDNLVFKIIIKNFISCEREYYFYLVSNNENK